MSVQMVCLGWHWQPYRYSRDASDVNGAPVADVPEWLRDVGRAAVGDPAIFRRKASPQRGAAAVAWVIARANDTVGGYWSGLTVQDLLAPFGVTGSVSQRAEPLLRANGVDPHRLYGSMKLGVPDLLTSRKRAAIVQHRDRYLGRHG